MSVVVRAAAAGEASPGRDAENRGAPRGTRGAPSVGGLGDHFGAPQFPGSARIAIDRMQVALHGVSPAVGEAFPGELGRALEQRLTGPVADALTAVDLRQLALGRIALEHTPEAGALAGLVAERLVEALVARAGAARRD